MEVILYHFTVCRLCAKEDINGLDIFSPNEEGEILSDLINKYLPLKVDNDGKYSTTICSGCAIDLEATIKFFNFIISGQKALRDLYKAQTQALKAEQKAEEQNVNIMYEIKSDGQIYAVDHPLSLQVEGLEKPRRKRGRPPKKLQPTEPEIPVIIQEPQEIVKEELLEASGKRKRKAPQRFREAVQGKELERIFREEGVIEGDESDNEYKNKAKSTDQPEKVDDDQRQFKEDDMVGEIIGHMETPGGDSLGQLVVVNKGKGRGRPKGRGRSRKETCAICGRVFSSLGTYMRHVAQHGTVLYQCVSCQGTFSTRLAFDQHQQEQKHEGQIILQAAEQNVPECVKQEVEIVEIMQSRGISSAEVSETNLNLSPDECDLFTDVATSEIETSRLEEASQNIDNIVDICTTENIQEPTQVPKTTSKPQFSCSYCSKLFICKQNRDVHIKATHLGERPYSCKLCNMTFAYHKSLKQHMAVHGRGKGERGYACDLCGKVLNHPSSVLYHKEAEHNNGQRFICIKCNKSFKHRQLLQRHQLVHSEARPFVCKTCDATFKTKANLLNHHALHTGVKRFKCDICKHQFAHKTSLTLHMRWHTGDKPYKCQVCGKCFSQNGNLSEHMRTHTGEKPYACATCGRCFTTSSQRRLHQRRHNGERPYKCNDCGKRFFSKETFRVHNRRHRGDLPFSCEHCGRAFAERWALQKHLRQHTGERPYPCEHCGRTFADCSNLAKHRKIHEEAQANTRVVSMPSRSLLHSSALQQPNLEEIVVCDEGEEEVEVEDESEVEGEGEGGERVIYLTYSMDEQQKEGVPTLHILDPAEAAELDESKVLTTCDLYEGESLLVGDEQIALASREQEHILRGDGGQAPMLHGNGGQAHMLRDDGGQTHIMHSDRQPLHQHQQVMELSQDLPMMDSEGNQLHFTMEDGTRIAITTSDGQPLQVSPSIQVEMNQDDNADYPQQCLGIPVSMGSHYTTLSDKSIPVAMNQVVELQEEGVLNCPASGSESRSRSASERGEQSMEVMAPDGQTVRLLSYDDANFNHYFTIV